MAKAIAESILKFKEDYFAATEVAKSSDDKESAEENAKTKENESGSKKTFKVQIATSKKKVDATASNFKGLKNIRGKFENG